MIKNLLIAAFVFIAVGAYTEAYSGFSCCRNGQLVNDCPNPGMKDGKQQYYDVSGCSGGNMERLCSDGSLSINGECVSINLEVCEEGYHMLNGVCVQDSIPAVVIKCEAFTSPAGHQVPETNRNQSVQMGCYTYSCSALGSWSTTNTCECKPGATYYRPCGDCGTQSRTCSSDGKFGSWGLCPISSKFEISDKLEVSTDIEQSVERLDLNP